MKLFSLLRIEVSLLLKSFIFKKKRYENEIGGENEIGRKWSRGIELVCCDLQKMGHVAGRPDGKYILDAWEDLGC